MEVSLSCELGLPVVKSETDVGGCVATDGRAGVRGDAAIVGCNVTGVFGS